jgi:hypothetical protein
MDKQFDAGNFPTKLDLSKFDPNLIEELQRLSVLQSERVEVSLKRPNVTDTTIWFGDPNDQIRSNGS